MSQVSQSEPVRNTKGTGQIQAYRWQFTLKYTGEPKPEELHKMLMPYCKELYFQLEKGEEDGYEHYQGCFSLKNKERMNTVKNLININVHVEPAKDWIKLKKYSTKEETRIDGPWTHESEWIELPEKLYEWQQKIVDECKKKCTNDRIINWYWEEQGCKGKTVLCKYLISKLNACFISGGTKDIAYSLPDNPKIVIMNITRTNEDKVNYGAIESVKDGLIFSAKYESKTKIFNSPHVYVFANFEPDKSKMSLDRWNVIKL